MEEERKKVGEKKSNQRGGEGRFPAEKRSFFLFAKFVFVFAHCFLSEFEFDSTTDHRVRMKLPFRRGPDVTALPDPSIPLAAYCANR